MFFLKATAQPARAIHLKAGRFRAALASHLHRAGHLRRGGCSMPRARRGRLRRGRLRWRLARLGLLARRGPPGRARGPPRSRPRPWPRRRRARVGAREHAVPRAAPRARTSPRAAVRREPRLVGQADPLSALALQPMKCARAVRGRGLDLDHLGPNHAPLHTQSASHAWPTSGWRAARRPLDDALVLVVPRLLGRVAHASPRRAPTRACRRSELVGQLVLRLEPRHLRSLRHTSHCTHERLGWRDAATSSSSARRRRPSCCRPRRPSGSRRSRGRAARGGRAGAAASGPARARAARRPQAWRARRRRSRTRAAR